MKVPGQSQSKQQKLEVKVWAGDRVQRRSGRLPSEPVIMAQSRGKHLTSGCRLVEGEGRWRFGNHDKATTTGKLNLEERPG